MHHFLEIHGQRSCRADANNSLFFPATWPDIISRAAVAVPVKFRLAPNDAGCIVAHGRPGSLICDEATAAVVRAAVARPRTAPAIGCRSSEHVGQLARRNKRELSHHVKVQAPAC
jgi:hypothetical protein